MDKRERIAELRKALRAGGDELRSINFGDVDEYPDNKLAKHARNLDSQVETLAAEIARLEER